MIISILLCYSIVSVLEVYFAYVIIIVIHSKVMNIIIITNYNVIVMLMILLVLWESYISLFDFLRNFAAGSKVTTKYFNLFPVLSSLTMKIIILT